VPCSETAHYSIPRWGMQTELAKCWEVLRSPSARWLGRVSAALAHSGAKNHVDD
jgi:hypothetical protein